MEISVQTAKELANVLVEDAGKLHHVERCFAPEDFSKFCIGDDAAFVFRILKIVFFDVFPNLFDDLRTREFICSDDLCELF